MPNMILMVGVPGAGKSTVRNKFLVASKEEYVVLSSDDILDQIAKDQGKTYDEIFSDNIKFSNSEFSRKFDQAVREKKNILIDRTNLTPPARKKFIAIGKRNGYRMVAANIETPPIEELARRLNNRSETEGKTIPADVIRSMISSLIPATKAEGFDDIF